MSQAVTALFLLWVLFELFWDLTHVQVTVLVKELVCTVSRTVTSWSLLVLSSPDFIVQIASFFCKLCSILTCKSASVLLLSMMILNSWCLRTRSLSTCCGVWTVAGTQLWISLLRTLRACMLLSRKELAFFERCIRSATVLPELKNQWLKLGSQKR